MVTRAAKNNNKCIISHFKRNTPIAIIGNYLEWIAIDVCVYMYIYVCMHVNVGIYIYMNTHIHIYDTYIWLFISQIMGLLSGLNEIIHLKQFLSQSIQ